MFGCKGYSLKQLVKSALPEYDAHFIQEALHTGPFAQTHHDKKECMLYVSR
jgi:hypothetical protein